jgi:hypothetical protein
MMPSSQYQSDGLCLADKLGELLGKQLEKISQKDFDPRGQYKKVVDAVKSAGNGHAEFYKVELDSARTQYIVLSIDEKHGRIVGLKALAVES